MGMQASPLRQASLHPEIPPMRSGLIWGFDTWMTYPYLIGGDDFTAHLLIFARGIEHQKPKNLPSF
tara:strand:+ start:291 stop:488 length:198 start_codon:yes stop_codon:yes gene_type:complete